MCDLISRNELIKDIRKRSYIDKPLKEIFETIIDGQPTVSEKEIREKAIEEFSEKLKEKSNWLETYTRAFGNTARNLCELIDEIAEQMKEVE